MTATAPATTPAPFVPPPYPYDRLDEVVKVAAALPGGAIDLSVGTPCDPPPAELMAALSASPSSAMGYPSSIGSPALRQAAARWIERRLNGPALDPARNIAACVGTKEFVASTPQYLKLRRPDKDTVLYPALSYPTYEMGATLAGVRAVPFLTLADISEDDAARALCLWVNSPSNPTGELSDLGEAAAWGRAHDVPVLSDECYAEFTWDGPARTILEHGVDGVLAVHSLSKRDNFAGGRIGFYAGDPELVYYLGEVRKHAGCMPPGPMQGAAVLALDDDEHVERQRERYLNRLKRMQQVLAACGLEAPLPAGTFYLWAPVAPGAAWDVTRSLAEKAGIVVSPGEFYGQAASDFLRVAVVQPDDKIELAAQRVGLA